MVAVQNNDHHYNCPVKKGSTFQSADEVIQCVTEFCAARFPPLYSIFECLLWHHLPPFRLATFTATLVFLGAYCGIIYCHNSTMLSNYACFSSGLLCLSYNSSIYYFHRCCFISCLTFFGHKLLPISSFIHHFNYFFRYSWFSCSLSAFNSKWLLWQIDNIFLELFPPVIYICEFSFVYVQ